MTADPKPAKRIKADKETWETVLLPAVFAQGILASAPGLVCLSDELALFGWNAHHLVLKGNGGDDVLENLIGLTGQGNATGMHGKVHTRNARALGRLREHLLLHHPEKIAYIVAKKGEWYLDKYYPAHG